MVKTEKNIQNKRHGVLPIAAQALEKTPTGILGLDEITGGGLPKGRPTLVCGGAGSGKTILAMEFLVRGARQFDEPGVFMAFEENEEELDRLIANWTISRSAEQVMTLMQGEGVPAGAVLDTAELSNDPHLRKRGMFVPVQHPKRGEVVVPGWPVHMSGSKVPVTCGPLLGEHTEQVLAEWAGMNKEQIAEYVKETPLILKKK